IVEPEPVLVEAEAEVEPELAPEPVWVPEPEPVLVEAEAAAVVELEPVPVEAEAAPVPEVEPEPEPVAMPEPEQLPYRPLRPISDTFLHYPPTAGRDGEVPAAAAAAAAAADQETLAARRAQLDLLGLGDTGQGPVGRPERVVLPYRSSGAAPRRAELHAAAAGPSPARGAFWDASAREVAGAISQIGVRTCGHCELSLSASARFCRRCGTPQSQSA
ncbi:MAG: hypothetical protein ACXWWU_01560, partial [Candidatus Limnocylindria bacterium]